MSKETVEDVKDNEEAIEQVVTPEEAAEKLFDNSKAEGADVKPDEEEVKEEDQKDADQSEESTEQAEEQEETTEEKKPEELELSLSKDSPLDQGFIDGVAEFAKENELSNEDAQQILTHKEDAVLDYIEDGKVKLNSQADVWLKEIKSDPVLGGDNFEKSQQMALKPLNDPRFVREEDKQEMNKFLADTRIVDNPLVFRLFNSVGMAMSDDTYLHGTKPVTRKPTAEELFYGK